MDRMFDNPWILRITALLLACLLFFYVRAEFDSSTKTATNEQVEIIKDVPVEVYYDDESLIVTGLPETVNVTIRGPMPIVLKAKSLKDFTVFVDLTQTSMGEHTVTLQYENLSEKLEVTLDPTEVDIIMEEKVTKEFRVDPEMNNLLIKEGYILAGMSASPATVFITGAKSTIDSISYVKATVTEEAGLTKSFEQEANVKVLDRDLNKLDVTMAPEKINVKVGIEEYSREIPLVLNQIGSPIEGVTIDNIALAIGTVKVTGSKAKIDQLEQIAVDFDVSKIGESKDYEVELKLPDGVTSISPKKVTVKAKVTVAKKTEVEAEVKASEEPVTPTSNAEKIDS